MSISQAMCTLFKKDLLLGDHHLDTDAIRIALYTSSASLSAATDGYTTSNEITNSSGTAYTSGGATLTSVTPTTDSTTAVCDFSDVSFTSASFTANGALIYNSSASGNPACAVIAFGSDKTVTSGTFTIPFPTADAPNALIRFA